MTSQYKLIQILRLQLQVRRALKVLITIRFHEKNYVKLQCIFSHYFLETSPSVENSSATSSSRRSTKDNTPLDGATTASATSDTINFVSGNPFVEVTKGINRLIFFP